jgi:hypothetical protein
VARLRDAVVASETSCPGGSVRAGIVKRQRSTGVDDDEDGTRADLDDDTSAERGIAEAMFVANNDAYIDWWLLQRFPSKTLEELETVDWVRLQRAMEVDRIVEAEQRRRMFFELGTDSKHKPSGDDVRLWLKHDRLLGEDEGGY